MLDACSTFHDRSVLRGVDARLGAAVLWRLDARADGPALVVPDLSLDVVWAGEGPPRPVVRTVEPIRLAVCAGTASVGIRFPPATVAMQVDERWPGWSAQSSDRAVVLRRALRVGAVRHVVDARVDAILMALAVPMARVADAARRLDVSERQLLRWCRDALGLTPKQVQRHLRLRRYLERDPLEPLADRAIGAGFFDQSHAANEIRALTGARPSDLLRYGMAGSSKTPPLRLVDARG